MHKETFFTSPWLEAKLCLSQMSPPGQSLPPRLLAFLSVPVPSLCRQDQGVAQARDLIQAPDSIFITKRIKQRCTAQGQEAKGASCGEGNSTETEGKMLSP